MITGCPAATSSSIASAPEIGYATLPRRRAVLIIADWRLPLSEGVKTSGVIASRSTWMPLQVSVIASDAGPH
jgi:hypothetical protein